ncbi:uncharacterized protein LOC117924750 [Vitis riparia]|uniref:uncharacterized protein LOC117924750 n=1 Tax=Vitis riparia TaxID=96939 RepID=UPI00155A3E59|nr:uncharacterized protein LOC117924750 [Vitis riparia]
MALGCMLAQLDDSGKERAIYYLSKRMLEYECRYIMIEHLYLALVWATRRLRHYVTEYSVLLVSRLDPLRYLFDRPVLTVFDDKPIDNDFPDEQFVSVTSIVGWQLYFDGAANQSGFGIGILLISPQGDHIPRSVRLTFSDHHRLTNNIVEYEACIIGLEIALDLGVRQLEIHRDSNLGIDIIGKISPKSSSGHEYILVFIDYFTKWVEAASYARLTAARVAKFIRSHIIWRYGVLYELISDRGMHFMGEVDTVIQEYGIQHHRSSVYRP